MSDPTKKARIYAEIVKTSPNHNHRIKAARRLWDIFSRSTHQQVSLLYGKNITAKFGTKKSYVEDSFSALKVKIEGLTKREIKMFKIKNEEIETTASLLEQILLFGNYEDSRETVLEMLNLCSSSRRFDCFRRAYLDSNFNQTAKKAGQLLLKNINNPLYHSDDSTLRTVNNLLYLPSAFSEYNSILAKIRKVARHGPKEIAKDAVSTLANLADYEGLATAIMRSEDADIRAFAARLMVSSIFKSIPNIFELVVRKSSYVSVLDFSSEKRLPKEVLESLYSDPALMNAIKWLRYASLRSRDFHVINTYIAPALAKLEDREGLLLMVAHTKKARIRVLDEVPEYMRDVDFLKRLVSISNFRDSAELAIAMLIKPYCIQLPEGYFTPLKDVIRSLAEMDDDNRDGLKKEECSKLLQEACSKVGPGGAQEILNIINNIKRPSPSVLPLINELKEYLAQK